jgi:hypothetical protein
MRICVIEWCEEQATLRSLCRQHASFFRSCGRLNDFPKMGGKYGSAHKKVKKALYNVFFRCTSPKDKKFKYYGGRGIRTLLTIEDVQFLWNRDGAAQMKRPSIDRKNNDGDYTRENCRFIEHVTNIKNSWRNRRRERGKAISVGKKSHRIPTEAKAATAA